MKLMLAFVALILTLMALSRPNAGAFPSADGKVQWGTDYSGYVLDTSNID
jgi:hypothetical protein